MNDKNGDQGIKMVVGISGGTNSGKTLLVDRILPALSSYSCSVLHIDDYYVEIGDPRLTYIPELDHCNWDNLNAIDMAKAVSFVTDWRESVCENRNRKEILLVEGILMFNYRPLVEMFDKKYFLTVSENLCRERRCKRSDYVPADVPGYYDLIVWPCYQKYLKEIQHRSDITFLDSSKNKDLIFSTVYEDILAALK